MTYPLVTKGETVSLRRGSIMLVTCKATETSPPKRKTVAVEVLDYWKIHGGYPSKTITVNKRDLY